MKSTAAHDAFISYSHSADSKIATALEAGLERLARPLLRIRAIDVFRDETSLTASPGLWSAIVDHLSAAKWFLLIASPESATSPWCEKELAWWLDNRPADRILIAVTAGDIAWATNDFDWNLTTALPNGLRGRIREEPLYVDLRWARVHDHLTLEDSRFRDAVVGLAAPIREMTRDELYSEDARQLRKSKRLVHGLQAGVGLGLVAAVVFGVVAWQQRNEAREQRDLAVRQATIAQSRLFVVDSRSQLGSRVDLALASAARAVRLNPSSEAKGALIDAFQWLSPVSHVLKGHAGAVSSIAFDSEARNIVTAGGDKAVVKWDTRGGVPIERLHRNLAENLILSPNARYIAAVDHDGTVVIDLASGKKIGERLPPDDAEGVRVVFSSDENWLVAESGKHYVVWNLLSGKRHQINSLAGMNVWSISLSSDGQTLAAGDGDGKITLVDARSGTRISSLGSLGQGITKIEFSTDGSWLATASLEGLMKLWNLRDPAKSRAFNFEGIGSQVTSLRFASANEHLVVGRMDGVINVINCVTGRTEATFYGHREPVWDLALSRDGRWLASASRDGTAILWSLSPSDVQRFGRFTNLGASPVVAFNADGSLLATVGRRGSKSIVWNTQTRQAVSETIVSGMEGPSAATFNTQGVRVVLAGSDGAVAVWDVGTGRATSTIVQGGRVGEYRTAISKDGRMVARGRANDLGEVIFLDVETGRPVRPPLLAHKNGVSTLAFSPDDTRLLTASYGGELILWNVAGGDAPLKLTPVHDIVDSVAFSSDGTRIAIAESSKVSVWDARIGARIAGPIEGHDRPIWHLTFSPDGQLLASGGGDRAVVLWEVGSGRQIARLGLPGTVSSIAFHPKGKYLAAGSSDGSTFLWSMDAAAMAETACAIVDPGAAEKDWKRILDDIPYPDSCR